MNFETQLKKLKYQVLREVSLLAKEERLNKEELEKIQYSIIHGNKPQYRCCIYKERAIVYERAQLASGNMPTDSTIPDLVNIMDDDQIMYVIEAACDNCPIDRFMVTEACRGCIQHKCMEVCHFGAITTVAGRAYINQELCRECGMCKKECPYNAIAEVMRPCKKSCPTGALELNPEDKKAMINQEQCINCGACMSACPFGAISDKSYIVNVTKELIEGKKVYAVVAPAFSGQFGDNVTIGMVKDALIKAGFLDMYEAALGADAVTVHEGKELKHRLENGDKFMTSSCCPAFVNYVEKMYPELTTKISDTVSPMAACGKLLKKMDKESVVVFIGPCTAKKAEIKTSHVKDSIDYVLTFEEAAALLGAFDIEPETCEDLEVIQASLAGRNFAKGGGLSEALGTLSEEINGEFKTICASGSEELKQVLGKAKLNRLEENFIEGMMCEGGCIGGAGCLVSKKKSKQDLLKYANSSSEKAVENNRNLKMFEGINLGK